MAPSVRVMSAISEEALPAAEPGNSGATKEQSANDDPTRIEVGATSVLREILRPKAFDNAGTATQTLGLSADRQNYLIDIIKNISSKVCTDANLQRTTRKRKDPTGSGGSDLPAPKKPSIRPGYIASTNDDFPKRLAWERHPLSDHSDGFYRDENAYLYRQIETLVQEYFGQPIPKRFDAENISNSPWLQNLPAEFYTYAGFTAQPDAHSGGWGRLMCDPGQRKWLVMGILARVLERNVFSELLFGAHEQHITMLENMEKAMVFEEGYKRTALRAHAVRTLIGNYAVTTHFDQNVARISAQLILLLKPLVTYLSQIHNKHILDSTYPPTDALVQGIHDIVSRAGYLSICIRHDTSIFSFHYHKPGSAFDPKEHNCADLPYFQSSKENVIRDQLSQPKAAQSGSEVYRALTKIGVWPSITRYKSGSGVEGGQCDGFRVVNVCKAEVVSYWGWSNAKTRKRIGLQNWLAEHQGTRR